MTDKQQPEEHCGHECVCAVLSLDKNDDGHSPCSKVPDCKHDTRSSARTAPAFPLTDLEFGHLALRLNECRCDTCNEIGRKLCDARKAAVPAAQERIDAGIQQTPDAGMLFSVRLVRSEYTNPSSDNLDERLFWLVVSSNSGEQNLYLMPEEFWNRLEKKVMRLIAKFFKQTNEEKAIKAGEP